MTISEAKEMDMVDYLSKLGHKPDSIKGNDYWYISPLGDEKTPSFKINRKMNRWYDFRDGRGGNLVDFGIAYHQCSIPELLEKLSGQINTVEHHSKLSFKRDDEDKKTIHVVSIHPVTSISLLRYLHHRRIHDEVADKYLKEIRYQSGDKNYYALGFKNDAGGYELRNEKFKGSSTPKDITFINNEAKELAVFEGFFNFLSYLTMHHLQEHPDRNFLVLNSTSFFEKSLPRMQEHNSVHLYLDNDKTGQKFTEQALSLDKLKFKDERSLYQKHGDLNDWLMHLGQSQKNQLRQKP